MHDSDERAATGGASADRTVAMEATEGMGPPRPAFAALEPGTQVGAYMVIEKIGEGGMGVVYAAWDPRLQRRVALKLVRSELGRAPEARQRTRLLREARAMARVQHPNVVPVYEVDEWDETVYIAMEFAEGGTLRAWIRGESRGGSRGEPRSWPEVLEVMVPVGRALATAHRAGLVHRDLKPDNILLDARKTPRVTDFGLAAATDESSVGSDPTGGSIDLAPLARITATGARVGTPAYAPPEQRRGEPVDGRGDQFSFCVTLFEALFGVRPFAETSGFDDELARRPPPSDVKVPGWLQRAIDRGLAPEPEERWPDMDALLDALRPPRRIWPAALGVAGLGAAVIGMATLGSGHDPCEIADAPADAVWSDGRRRALGDGLRATGAPHAPDTWARAETRIDDYVGDWRADRRDACAATHERGEQSGELLDLRMTCLQRRMDELDALLEVFAEADAALVDEVLPALGRLEPLAPCADAERLRAKVPPPADEATAQAASELRHRLDRAHALENAGRGEQALPLAGELVEDAERLGYEPVQAEAHHRLGSLLDLTGDYAASAEQLDAAAHLAMSTGDDRLAASIATRLVHVHGARLGEVDEALMWAGRADALLDRSDASLTTRSSLQMHLASLWRRRDRPDDAVALLRAAVDARRERGGPSLAAALNNLSGALYEIGEHEQAVHALREAATLWEDAYGPTHPYLGTALHNLAVQLAAQGKDDEAMTTVRRALDVLRTSLGPDHPEVALAHHSLGMFLKKRGELEPALRHMERSVEIWSDDPRKGAALVNLGHLYGARGETDKAEATYREAVREADARGTKDLRSVHAYLALAPSVERDEGATAVVELLAPLRPRCTARDELPPCAELAWALARARWDADEHREAALELARRAAAGFTAREDEQAAEVSSWLAERTGSTEAPPPRP